MTKYGHWNKNVLPNYITQDNIGANNLFLYWEKTVTSDNEPIGDERCTVAIFRVKPMARPFSQEAEMRMPQPEIAA